MHAAARQFFLLVPAASRGSQRRKDRPPGREHPRKRRGLPANRKQTAYRECLQLPKRATECLYFPARPPITRIVTVTRGDAGENLRVLYGLVWRRSWRDCRTLNRTRRPPRCARFTRRP